MNLQIRLQKKHVITLFVLLQFSLNVFSQESELVLSSRWFHPRNNQDTLSTVKAINEFKPSRIDWTYTTDSFALAIYKKMGIPYSLTINPMVPDSMAYTTPSCRMHTIEGETYVAPWMKKWKIKTPYWGCVNSPEFKQIFHAAALDLLKLGAYGLMMDNPELNMRLVMEKRVGCFCNHCVKGFNPKKVLPLCKRKKWLAILRKEVPSIHYEALVTAYEKYQEESVVVFLTEWKAAMLRSYPTAVFLNNNFNGQWLSFHRVFDGGIAELNEDKINEANLKKLYAEADRYGKTQLFCSNSTESRYHETLFKYALKTKRPALIPWDVYTKNSSNRYFMSNKRLEILKNER